MHDHLKAKDITTLVYLQFLFSHVCAVRLQTKY